MRSKGSAHFSKVSSDATSVVLGSFVGAECKISQCRAVLGLRPRRAGTFRRGVKIAGGREAAGVVCGCSTEPTDSEPARKYAQAPKRRHGN
jgi:hypothetical protein